MRKRRWLLIVIFILIMINLIFWGVTSLFDVNRFVENKLTNTVGKQLDATISFSTLNATSKFLQISDLEIHKEGEYTFKAKQLYLNYSFWELILHNFRIEKALKEIRCFSPELMYISTSGEDHESLTIDLDALEKTLTSFNYISIINGKVDVQGVGNIRFSESLDRVNINLQKRADHEWHIVLSATQSQHDGIIEIEGLYAQHSNQFSIHLKDYQISEFFMKNLVLDNAFIDAEIETNLSDIITGKITVKDIGTAYHDEVISSDFIEMTLTSDSLTIEDFSIRWKNNKALCGGNIYDYLSKNSDIDLSLTSEDLDLGELLPQLVGTIDIKGKISGSYSSPEIDITLLGDQYFFNNIGLDDMYINLAYHEGKLAIKQGSFMVNANPVNLSGDISVNQDELSQSSIDMSIESSDFSYILSGINLQADVIANMSGVLEDPVCEVRLDNMVARKNTFLLQNLSGEISYTNKKAIFSIQNPNQSLYIKGVLAVASNFTFDADIFTNKLAFGDLLINQPAFIADINPYVDTNFHIRAESNIVSINGWVNFEEKNSPTLHGRVKIQGELPLALSVADGYFDITSDSLIIYDEPVEITFHSKLTQDNHFSAELGVNRSLDANVSGIIRREGIEYSGQVFIDSLSFEKANSVFSFFEKDIPLEGLLSARFDFENTEIFTGKGQINVSDFSFSNILHSVNVQCDFEVDSDMISLDKVHVRNSQSLLIGHGNLNLSESTFEFKAASDNVILEDMFSDFDITGLADYSLTASGKTNNPNVLCDLSIDKGSFLKTAFDSFKSQVLQDSAMFNINEMEMHAPDFTFSGNGTYSYNFIKEEFHNQPDGLRFQFSGDLLEVLMPYLPAMKNASSKTDFRCSIKTEDMDTVIDSAFMNISDGQFTLKSQPEKIKDFSCNILIEDNIVSSFNGSLVMGDGRLYLKNNIQFDDSDIMVGDINLGRILLNNDEQGITIHIPKYQPERGLVDARLTGFDSDYFSIYSEDDGWVLSGRILLSNGDAIYEEDEEYEEDTDEGIELPPLYADFDLVFSKNIWYVSTPFNLKVDPGNFMSFRSDRDTEKLDLFFDLHSRQGEMRLFGESFSAEDVIVRKARKDKKVFIDATFKKRTPDGSTIYLYVRSTEDKLNADDIGTQAYGDVEVTLKSDNPKDVTMLSMLSKIQYGKEIDQLSEEERFDLGTEQAINLASDELSDLIFSPLISPVEGMIRQFLGLDYVRFKTGFMKNIFLTSGIVESEDYIVDREYDSDLELLGELSKDILLENLAIDLGKYITPEWYLNYEALVKKEMTARRETYIGVQHELSFTWDLPYNFRFIYRYQFYPAQGKDNQGISLETVFRF